VQFSPAPRVSTNLPPSRSSTISCVDPKYPTIKAPAMQSRLRANALRGLLLLVLTGGLHSIGAPRSATAQQVDRLAQSALIDDFARTDPGDLTAADLIDLYRLQTRLGSSADLGVWASTFDELAWWWAAERSLDVDTAVSQLTRAYEEQFGQPNRSVVQRLREHLAGLPTPGSGVYQAPSYIPEGLARRIRRPPVIGRPPFGPMEKNGISRLSTRIRP
jgi:hypothetical protein